MIPPQLRPLLNHFSSPDHEPDIGQGWWDLARACHDELVAEFPEYQLHAVKQKWGVLAFQAFPLNPIRGDWTSAQFGRCSEITDSYTDRSATVCERCGAPGSLRESRPIELTLCDKCEAVVGPAGDLT
jgi:hypothetical protein